MTEPVSIDPPWDAADPVDEALHTLRVSGAFARESLLIPHGEGHTRVADLLVAPSIRLTHRQPGRGWRVVSCG